MKFSDNDNQDIQEKKFMIDISDSLIEHKNTISLLENIETIFPFQTLTASDLDDCGFLKIPLWKFPFITKTPFEHLNYIRQQLSPVLQPFKDKLQELQNDFFTMDFIPENMSYFKK